MIFIIRLAGKNNNQVDYLPALILHEPAFLIKTALAGQLVVLPHEGGQLEGFQMMGQQELWRVAHDATPVSSPMYELAEVVATSARGR